MSAKPATSMVELLQDKFDRRAVLDAGKPIPPALVRLRLHTIEGRLAAMEALLKPIPPVVSIERPGRKHSMMVRIRQIVADACGIPVAVLTAKARGSEQVSFARFAGCYLARELTQFTSQETAKFFGLRDSSGASHGARRMRDMISVDTEVAKRINALRVQLEKEFAG